MQTKSPATKFILSLSLGLFSLSSYAYHLDLSRGKFTIQAGGYTAHQGTSQHVNIQGLIGDDFNVTSHTDTKAFLGLGYYAPVNECNLAKSFIGINAFYLPNAAVNGTVTQEGLFTNLSYRYDTSNYPIFLDVKAEFKTKYSAVTPTFDVGIGPNFAQTSGFSEKSLDNGVTLPDNIYTGDTTVSLGATVGVGVKFNNVTLYPDAPLECGYRFFYLGNSSLEKNNSQVQTTLKGRNGYANALLCSVSI